MNTKKITQITGFAFICLIILSYIFSGRIEEFFTQNSDIKESSLILFAFIIGLIDGFNPCAMWVLIYLITLVSQLKDIKKMWIIVGTFLLASGIVYYIILMLWLQGWNYLSYLVGADWILKAAGIFALATGGYFLYQFYKSGGELVCKVENFEKRKKTMSKIQSIVHSPITILSIFGILALAFAVNITEFVCSIGLPALFTQVISASKISFLYEQVLLLVYILGFLLDDLIIFFFALKAIESPIFDKYSGLSKLIGGAVMLLLGIILLFFPQFLL